jgi:hypothetical protein
MGLRNLFRKRSDLDLTRIYIDSKWEVERANRFYEEFGGVSPGMAEEVSSAALNSTIVKAIARERTVSCFNEREHKCFPDEMRASPKKTSRWFGKKLRRNRLEGD